MEFTFSTPALLFPAISLLMLAYTNRFFAIANRIRSLAERFQDHHEEHVIEQIKSLRVRLYIIRNMQILGVTSIFLCILSMFFMYVHELQWAKFTFGVGLVTLIISLTFSLRELLISTQALDLELKSIEKELNE
jgi:Protein of unknown function (DUF2721)